MFCIILDSIGCKSLPFKLYQAKKLLAMFRNLDEAQAYKNYLETKREIWFRSSNMFLEG